MLDITINDKINISIDTETKADKHTHPCCCVSVTFEYIVPARYQA